MAAQWNTEQLRSLANTMNLAVEMHRAGLALDKANDFETRMLAVGADMARAFDHDAKPRPHDKFSGSNVIPFRARR